MLIDIRVLLKTPRTGIIVDEVRIDRLLSSSAVSGGGFYKVFRPRPDKSGNGKVKKAGGGGGGGAGGGVRHREGIQVGEGAERIGRGNIGHQLLSRMGYLAVSVVQIQLMGFRWAEGDRIGRTGGLDNP